MRRWKDAHTPSTCLSLDVERRPLRVASASSKRSRIAAASVSALSASARASSSAFYQRRADSLLERRNAERYVVWVPGTLRRRPCIPLTWSCIWRLSPFVSPHTRPSLPTLLPALQRGSPVLSRAPRVLSCCVVDYPLLRPRGPQGCATSPTAAEGQRRSAQTRHASFRAQSGRT